MKNISKICVIAQLVLLTVVFASCNKDAEVGTDSITPGKVSEISLEPTHGGVKIHYILPTDDDVSYVKASYTNSLGEDMFSVCSAFENVIEIIGINDTEKHIASIETVDLSGNLSDKIEITFTALESHIELVKENLTISPTFGGVSLKWDNVEEKTVYVHLIYKDDTGNDVVNFFSSSKSTERFTLRGLDTQSREFFVQVEDFFGNKTEMVSKGKHSPAFEVEIDKSKWSLVSSLSVDGNAWEGSTVNLWDGVIDTKESSSDDSYAMISRDNNGGQLNFPLDIVINMNAEVVMSRVQLWQRAFWYGNDEEYFYYQNENFKAFDLYTSNDLQEWTKVGSFDIGDPKNGEGVVSDDKIREAIDGHIFVLDNPTETFKYLKFSITENYGSEVYVNVSELSMFGL